MTSKDSCDRLATAARPPHRLGRRDALVVVWLLLNLVVLELATRAFFTFRVGPRVLFYGTSWHRKEVVAPAANPLARNSQFHEDRVGDHHGYVAGEGSYSKYFPREEKWTESPDRGTSYPIRINQSGVPRVLLVHARLMGAERRWAADAGVPLVDMIHELDGDRDLLVNWVHLRPEANAKIARALAAAIRTELARPTPPTTR